LIGACCGPLFGGASSQRFIRSSSDCKSAAAASGDTMFGINIILPFLAMMVGALFGMQIYGADALVAGGAIGFGIGCAILALIWLLFAILKKWAG
jgi:hypothetical protein